MKYKWKFREQKFFNPKILKAWSLEFDISVEILKILISRGINTKEKINTFISPLIRYLPPLNSWHALIKTANFLCNEIKKRSKIAIWGDYDVDGICSSVILYDFLKKVGCDPKIYIPNRFSEGYGLNLLGLERLYRDHIETIITVDCGITNIKEVKRAKELGFKIIITDHHYPKDVIPEADVVLNPKISPCPYPNLAGVGVAFLLVAAVNKILSLDIDIKEYLDLVALGTLADLVELTLENRILVKNGLLYLKEAKRPGILALKEVSNLSPFSEVGSYEVSFLLAPRINSAGRMDDPKIAVELLLTKDLNRARELAKKLNSLNSKRQKIEDNILKEAKGMINQSPDLPAFVLFSDNWHEGVIGIVASKLVEEFYRPVILFTQNKEFIKGSGRSIPEFHLFKGLSQCEEFIENFGGHSQAAGLAVNPAKFEDFKEKFLTFVQKHFDGKILEPSILIDERLSFKSINLKLLKDLDILQPFGPGNPSPIFCSYPLKVQKYKRIKDKHVALELRDEKVRKTFWGKFWRMYEFLPNDIVGQEIVVAFTPKLNTFADLISIDLEVIDWAYPEVVFKTIEQKKI